MNITDKIEKYLVSESKVEVSPLLRSVLKTQTTFSDGEVESLKKTLNKVDTTAKISIAASKPYKEGDAYIIVNDDDSMVIKNVTKSLGSAGYKVKNTKKDGGVAYIYFSKKG